MKKTLLIGFLASLVASFVVADTVVRAENGIVDQPSTSRMAIDVQSLPSPSKELPPAVSRGAAAYFDVAAQRRASIEDIDAFSGARPLDPKLVADLMKKNAAPRPLVVITSSGGTIELIEMEVAR